MSLDRRPLFSVHTNDEGRIALYLEEQDAVLDLLEEAGKEANGDYIAATDNSRRRHQNINRHRLVGVREDATNSAADSFADCTDE